MKRLPETALDDRRSLRTSARRYLAFRENTKTQKKTKFPRYTHVHGSVTQEKEVYTTTLRSVVHYGSTPSLRDSLDYPSAGAVS